MKKHKSILKLIAVLFIGLAVAVSFTACGDDDDKDESDLNEDGTSTGSIKSKIIGSWEYSSRDFSFGYTFYRDGTGVGWEVDGKYEDWDFEYRVSGRYVIMEDEYGSGDETFIVKSITDNRMTIIWPDEDEGPYTLKRI